MINGSRCTRACGFCQVDTRHPLPLDAGEPERVARAVEQMGLAHAVITCVARDDLADGGAGGFAATIASIRDRTPRTTIEVLISDCKGDVGIARHRVRRPARRPQPQHRDGGPAAAGGPPVGRVRQEPDRPGPGQGRRAHHQVRASSSAWASGWTRCWPPWPTSGRWGPTSSPLGQYLRPTGQPSAGGPVVDPRGVRSRSPRRAWPWGSPMSRRRRSPVRAITPGRRSRRRPPVDRRRLVPDRIGRWPWPRPRGHGDHAVGHGPGLAPDADQPGPPAHGGDRRGRPPALPRRRSPLAHRLPRHAPRAADHAGPARGRRRRPGRPRPGGTPGGGRRRPVLPAARGPTPRTRSIWSPNW